MKTRRLGCTSLMAEEGKPSQIGPFWYNVVGHFVNVPYSQHCQEGFLRESISCQKFAYDMISSDVRFSAKEEPKTGPGGGEKTNRPLAGTKESSQGEALTPCFLLMRTFREIRTIFQRGKNESKSESF